MTSMQPGSNVSRWARLAVLGMIAPLVSACGGPGAGIAERIRAADSPVIREVRFSPANSFGHPEEIYVYMTSDATEAQIVDAWCNAVVPAGIDELLPERVGLLRSGASDPTDVTQGSSGLDKPTCP